MKWGPIMAAAFLGLASGLYTGHKLESRFESRRSDDEAEELPFHTVKVGAPRSGKSFSLANDILEWAREMNGNDPKYAIVLGDPHGPTADAAIETLIGHGFEDRLIVDDFSRRDKLLCYDVLPRVEPGSSIDPFDIRKENDMSLDIFSDLVIRDREAASLGPLQRKWLYVGGKCYQYQDKDTQAKNLRWMQYSLRPGTDQFNHLLAHCTEGYPSYEMTRVAQFRSVAAQAAELDPARRLTDPLFDCVDFDARVSGVPLNIRRMLEEKKILIMRGTGNTPRWARLMLMGSVFTLVHRTAEKAFAETGKPLPVKIIREECNGFPFVRQADIDRMAQSLKFGVEDITIWQHLNLKDTEIRDSLLGVVGRIEAFRQGYEGAVVLAREMGTHLLDAKKVKHVEERKRTMVTGMRREEIRRTSTSKTAGQFGRKTETEGTQIVQTPEHEVVTDRTITFEQLTDQEKMFARELMNLRVGYRYVKQVTRSGVTVTPEPERVLPLESPWAYEETAKREVAEALERIRQQPIYQTPDLSPPKVAEEPPPQKQQRRRGGKGMRKSSPSRTNTHSGPRRS